ncbi:MAG: hypothetical protein OEY69_00105 [Candidatus Krumholzibacteria bacterium]|nr:hypothetical protein [Candidatus Krumholzibacteria bacterium]
MSFYHVIFGQNQHATFILATLGLLPGDVGRFRDAFVAEGKIAIYTRNGGGNREQYQAVLDRLAQHPLYLSDADDDFDCTYCTIYFSLPEEWKTELLACESGTFNPDERWRKKLEAIQAGERNPAMEQLVERLKQAAEKGEGGTITV